VVESAVNIILTAEFSQLLDQVCREEINGVILLDFVYDIFDLVLDFFVFSKLSLQEFEGYSGFLFEAIGFLMGDVGNFVNLFFQRWVIRFQFRTSYDCLLNSKPKPHFKKPTSSVRKDPIISLKPVETFHSFSFFLFEDFRSLSARFGSGGLV
jgi:hypothetical protein